MPFQSEKQRRYLHANHPEIAKRWEKEYANGGISNHFRRRYFSGAYGQGAGDRGGNPYASRAENIASGHVSAGGGGGPPSILNPPPRGPSPAEIAAQKAAAQKKAMEEAQLVAKEMAIQKQYKKKKVDYSKKLQAFGVNEYEKLIKPGVVAYQKKHMPTYDVEGADLAAEGLLKNMNMIKVLRGETKPTKKIDKKKSEEFWSGEARAIPIAAVKEDLLKKQSWYTSPLKLKTNLAGMVDPDVATFKSQIKGPLTIEKYLDLSKKGLIPESQKERFEKQVLEAIKKAGGFGETFQKDWSTGVVEPTFKRGVLDIDESKLQEKEAEKYLQVAKGGLARKNYFHGGILGLNESEEIISDDGNNIELTDYNAAFDDPKDLSTGVKTLFQAKDGGNIRLQPHTATDLLVKKNPDGTRSKYQPPGGGDPGMYSAPSSDRGPRDDPDRFGPVSKPQTETKTTTTTGDGYQDRIIEIEKRKRKQELRRLALIGDEDNVKVPTYTERMNKIQDDIKAKWRKKIDPTLWEQYRSLPALDFLSIAALVIKDIYDKREMKKDMEMLASLGLDKGHPSGTDTAFSNLQDYFAKIKLRKDDEPHDRPEPIYTPITGAVGEEYAQGYYGMSDLERIRAGQAKRAMINPDWQEQPGLAYGQQIFNSGGLANLFRVKNQ